MIGLARYFLPLLPARSKGARDPIADGGEPGKAVCSTLIAQAFQSIRYPMFAPDNAQLAAPSHPGLCVPRDFDVSPYFAIVKPVPERSFDSRALPRAQPGAVQPASAGTRAPVGIAAG